MSHSAKREIGNRERAAHAATEAIAATADWIRHMVNLTGNEVHNEIGSFLIGAMQEAFGGTSAPGYDYDGEALERGGEWAAQFRSEIDERNDYPPALDWDE